MELYIYIYIAVRWSWARIAGIKDVNSWTGWPDIKSKLYFLVILVRLMGSLGLSFPCVHGGGLLGILSECGSECVARAHGSHACVSDPRKGQAICSPTIISWCTQTELPHMVSFRMNYPVLTQEQTGPVRTQHPCLPTATLSCHLHRVIE